MKKKIFALIALAVVGYFLYGRFFKHPEGMMAQGGAEGAAPVSVAEVLEKNVQVWREFSGRIVAVDRVEIRPRVAGTIDQIHFSEGQKVQKGDLLFTIDQRPYKAALDAAETREKVTSADLSRAKDLLAGKFISQKDFDQRRNDAETAKADLTKAKLDYEYSVVKSPIDGRVGRAEVTVGNLVDSGGGAPILTTIVSDNPVYADFDVDERTYVTYLSAVGRDAEKVKTIPVHLGLIGEQGEPHQGNVKSFDNELNPTSGTIRVRAVFDNSDGKLTPGLFARVRLGSPEEIKAVLITDRALITDQNKKFVLVVGEGNKTERREVKLDNIVGGLRIVNSGLKAGEKIVVSGTQRIMMPGQPVTPEIVPMDAKETPPPSAPAPASASEQAAPPAESATPEGEAKQ